MMLTQKHTAIRGWRTVLVAVFAIGLAAAVSGPASAAGSRTAAMPDSSSNSIVTVRTGPNGAYLADGAGRTLYMYAADKPGVSNCAGSCAQFWPSLKTTGQPAAGPGVVAGMLATFKPAGSSTQIQVSQVEYNGHPLYYFVKDTAIGETLGQGVNVSGGLFWLVDPDGNAITTSGASGQSTGSSSGNGATPAPVAPGSTGGHLANPRSYP